MTKRVPPELWKRRPRIERFWAKVSKGDGCWEWTAALNGAGYGYFAWTHKEMRPAHRIAYELTVGPIPAGLHLDHLCRNPKCVRPDHLEPVTVKENYRRGLWGERPACINGHPFTPENIYHYRGARICRACRKDIDARRCQKQKEARDLMQKHGRG